MANKDAGVQKKNTTLSGDTALSADQNAALQPSIGTDRHRREPRRKLIYQVQFIANALIALTALAALGLSLVTTIQLNHRADMSLTMPNIIRIEPRSNATLLIVQPTFAVQQKTDMTSVVTAVRFRITPPPENRSALPYFYWGDVVEFFDDLPAGKISGQVYI